MIYKLNRNVEYPKSQASANIGNGIVISSISKASPDAIAHRSPANEKIYPWFTSGSAYSFKNYNKHSDPGGDARPQNNNSIDDLKELFSAVSLIKSKQTSK